MYRTEREKKNSDSRNIKTLFENIFGVNWSYGNVIQILSAIFTIFTYVTFSPDTFAVFLLFIILLVVSEPVYNYIQGNLRLNCKWQVLAWTHYRSLLAKAMVSTIRAGNDERASIDFVTFYNGEFEEKAKEGGFYSEIQYSEGSDPFIDIVFFDLEYIDDLEKGISLGSDEREYSLTSISSFAKSDSSWKNYLTEIRKEIRNKCRFGKKVKALPISWGYNCIAISATDFILEDIKENTNIDLISSDYFDMSWICDPEHRLHEYIKESDRISLAFLDWYLPAMMILSLDLYAANINMLTQKKFNNLTTYLWNLKPLLSDKSFVKDPMDLARLTAEDELIVIGGGNWLRPEENKSKLLMKPVTRGVLLWCECLGFMSDITGSSRSCNSKSWRDDASKLLTWFDNNRQRMCGGGALNSFSAPEGEGKEEISNLTGAAASARVRELPPDQTKSSIDIVTRDTWSNTWDAFKTIEFDSYNKPLKMDI